MSDIPEHNYDDLSDSDIRKIEQLLKRYLPDASDHHVLIEFLSEPGVIVGIARDIFTPTFMTDALNSVLQSHIDSNEKFCKAVLTLSDAIEDEDAIQARMMLAVAVKEHDSSDDEYKKVMSALNDAAEHIAVLNAHIASNHIVPDESGSGRKESGRHFVARQLAKYIGNRINRTQKSKLISEIFEILGVKVTWESINQKLRDSGL